MAAGEGKNNVMAIEWKKNSRDVNGYYADESKMAATDRPSKRRIGRAKERKAGKTRCVVPKTKVIRTWRGKDKKGG